MNDTRGYFGDEEMTGQACVQVREEEANGYASREDFRKIFREDLDGCISLHFYSRAIPQRPSDAI